MGRRYNWGILGPGRIAVKFTNGLKMLTNANLYSVGSRSYERAEKFAKEYGFQRSYGSYEEFVNDPDLDIVYIATPHSHHKEHALLCLRNNKAVLCEKAFAMNSDEVEEMICEASKRELFLMEALWPPFQPMYKKAVEILEKGEIGKIVYINAKFSFRPPYDKNDRKFNPELGGGALLDIGIYPVMDTLQFMGVPSEIHAVASFAETGVEDSVSIIFKYSDNRMATLYGSFLTHAGTGTDIYCTNGTISVKRVPDGSQYIAVELAGKEKETFIYTPGFRGYHFEAEEVMRCLDEGKKESQIVPLTFSRDLINTLDKIRDIAGIEYRQHLNS
jgi:predicted dehydrogenase